MSLPCQMAGERCQSTDTQTIRIGAPVNGDRAICDAHIAVLERMGMPFRVLADEPKPAWMKRDLRRDETGRVLSSAA